MPDNHLPGYDERTDFASFVTRKGAEFQAGVLRLLADQAQTVRISSTPGDVRSIDKARETVAAMRAGTPIIAHGVLWNPHNQTYGTPDLLVRSDVLARLFPCDANYMAAHVGAPALELENAHYCVVDVKFRTLELLADGSASGEASSLPYLVQVWPTTRRWGVCAATGHPPPTCSVGTG